MVESDTELIKLLTETPLRISALSRKVLTMEQQIEVLDKNITQIERQQMFQISLKKDLEGKAQYTNEQSRNAALSQVLKDHILYNEAAKERDRLKGELAHIKIDLQEKVNLFAAYRAITRLRETP